MLTTAQLDIIRRADEDLDAVVIAQIRQVLRNAVATDNAQEFVDLLMETVPSVVTQLGGVAALLGVRAYDLGRATAGAPGQFSAEPAVTVAPERVQSGIRTALTPLWRQMKNRSVPVDLGQISEITAPQLQAAAETWVREANRDTIVDNTLIDPARPRYVRMPRPGACGFCRMLASRGAVYASERSATARTGRRRLKASGYRGDRMSLPGNEYHHHCKCTPVAVYDGDVLPPIIAEADKFWAEASKGHSGIEAIRAANRAAAAESAATN